MRHLYKQRRQVLLTSLVKEVGKWLEPIPSFYGMHIAATVRGSTSIDLERATETLLEHNIKIHTVRRYYLGQPGRPGLVFSYGAVGPTEIAQGLAVLRKVLS